MPVQKYQLHLVPPDLRPEEMYLQIADALEHLEAITEDIFKRVSSRVETYRSRVNSIAERAKVAQTQIDKIRGSSKAIRVFSSYKYPGPESIEDYSSFLTNGPELVPPVKTPYKVHSKHVGPDENTLKEKLQFNALHPAERTRAPAGLGEEGLGRLPHHLESVSTLLLFNTTENPYKKYVTLDPLGAVTRTRQEMRTDPQQLDEAPVSISTRQTDHQLEKHLFYSPEMGQVPEMDVPLALPDLPGVADDLLYSAVDLDSSIAPSLLPGQLPEITSSLPELPAVISPTEEEVGGPPPPPPPPPPPEAPPPPPPPIAQVVEVPDGPKVPPPTKTTPSKLPEVVAKPGSARADLLQSIRQAGGKARLKSAADRKLEAKKQKQEKQQQGGGDLMADLLNKLQNRRKGISGKSSISEDAPSTPLDRMLSLIPPPREAAESTSENEDSNDDEWD